jgi:hypothetical protein
MVEPDNQSDQENNKFWDTVGRATDSVVNAQFPYWGALLTFNAVIIAFGSQIAKPSSPLITFFLIALGLTSSFFIILGFHFRVRFLQKIAETIMWGAKSLDEKKAKDHNKAILIMEKIVFLLAIIQICIIFGEAILKVT